MTDKEFKRLGRAQLIDIIYQFQLREEELVAENQKLKAELEDRRIRIEQAGNIAEASLQINSVMQAAQHAADQYLEEIRVMRAEAEAACQQMLEQARQEAAAIRDQAGTPYASSDDSAVAAILEEYADAE